MTNKYNRIYLLVNYERNQKKIINSTFFKGQINMVG